MHSRNFGFHIKYQNVTALNSCIDRVAFHANPVNHHPGPVPVGPEVPVVPAGLPGNGKMLKALVQTETACTWDIEP